MHTRISRMNFSSSTIKHETPVSSLRWRMPGNATSSRGFTLLELLVVIVIIGLISGLVVPRYFDTVGKSKVKVARAQMASLEKALDEYRLEVGTYPTQEQGLDALMNAPAGATRWKGPYLKKAVPLDPWEHPYVYKLAPTGQDIDLVSLGSDGQPGGSGEATDIVLSEKE